MRHHYHVDRLLPGQVDNVPKKWQSPDLAHYLPILSWQPKYNQAWLYSGILVGVISNIQTS